jgi:hypothetical protein
MNFYNRFYPVILFLSFSFTVGAQLNYRSGFVITNENDTTYGYINEGGSIRNSKVCLYKSNSSSKPVKYRPGDIKSYRIDGGKYYVSQQLFHKGKITPLFTEVLLTGKINLYKDWRSRNMKYYLQMEDGNLTGLSNEDFRVQYETNFGEGAYKRYYWLTFKVFRDSLYSAFKASEKIQKHVDQVGYTQESLMNIAKAYLNETCKGKGCITYEKDLKESRSRFGAFAGIQASEIVFKESFENPRAKGHKTEIVYSYPFGIFYNFPISVINDRLFFQIELITNTVSYKSFGDLYDINYITSIKTRTLGMPLLIKYELTGKKLTPTLALGKETSFNIDSKVSRDYTEEQLRERSFTGEQYLHKIQKGGWFFEVGLDYKLMQRLSLFSNVRIQSGNNLIITEENDNRLSYSGALKQKRYLEHYKTNCATLFIGLRF